MGAGRGRGVILPSLSLFLFTTLLQGERRERNHATGQWGELCLSALVVILPGFKSWDGVWRRRKEIKRGIKPSKKRTRRKGEAR